MTHTILRSVPAAILVVCLAAMTASATDEEWSEQDEWKAKDELKANDELKAKDEPRDKGDQHGDHPSHRRDHDHDGGDRLLQVPGGSAGERARDALDPGYAQPPVPWVDTGPATNVDGQIEAIDRLLGTQEPAIVDGGETLMSGGDVAKGTFTDSDGTGWNYCSGKCIKRTQRVKRAGGTTDNVIRIKIGSCTCSCVLFDNTGKKLAKKLEVTQDDEKGYLNVGAGNPANYTVRCVEED